MNSPLTAATIISNAFDADYSAGQAIADLEKLMNEATLLELTHGPYSPRFVKVSENQTFVSYPD